MAILVFIFFLLLMSCTFEEDITPIEISLADQDEEILPLKVYIQDQQNTQKISNQLNADEEIIDKSEDISICSSNTYNCNHFSNWNEANKIYEECGGSGNDIHGLDTDDDGIPCETLSGAPEEETTEEEATSIKSKSYTCYSDTYNCADFDTYSEALEAYEACGGLSNDVHDLDRDHDGEPCESLN